MCNQTRLEFFSLQNFCVLFSALQLYHPAGSFLMLIPFAVAAVFVLLFLLLHKKHQSCFLILWCVPLAAFASTPIPYDRYFSLFLCLPTRFLPVPLFSPGS